MSTEHFAQHQERLHPVSDAFAEWRCSRQKRSPIPENPWYAATALSPFYSTHQIARTLRLDYARL